MSRRSFGEQTRVTAPSKRSARTRRWLLTLIAVATFPTLAAAQSTTQVVEYYSTDALGSVRAVTKRADGVLQITRHDFMPFGGEVAPPPPPSNKRLFTGKERDSETGMDYFEARYYRADIGRFTTIDPVYTWEENLTDPQRWNRYAYVRDNPLRFTDPDGREIRLSDSTGKDDAKYIRSALIDYVRTESGRAQFEKLAADASHTIVLTGAQLNDANSLQVALTTKRPVAVNFGLTDPDGATATVKIDRSVHTTTWATPAGVDVGGVTTIGHEFAHADAWASGDLIRYSQGDVPTSATGPAMQKGKAIYAERRVLSKKEAEAIVDSVLGGKK